tara:strand:- start:90 stop:800 length:711 start_codon:yes stop_codon:yes gene_type:complete
MTSTSTAPIAKIQKLLALGASANEHEAASATEKAHALLAQFNLSMAEVADTAEPSNIGHATPMTKQGSPWIRTLWQAVSQLNFCDYAASTGNHRTYHYVIGDKVNSASAVQMAEYLTATVQRLANEQARLQDGDAKWKTGFRQGCGERLALRLRNKLAELKSTEQAQQSTGSTLPAIYTGNQEIQDYMADVLNCTTSKKRAPSKTDGAGRMAGRASADSIGIDTQLGNVAPSGYIQ